MPARAAVALTSQSHLTPFGLSTRKARSTPEESHAWVQASMLWSYSCDRIHWRSMFTGEVWGFRAMGRQSGEEERTRGGGGAEVEVEER